MRRKKLFICWQWWKMELAKCFHYLQLEQNVSPKGGPFKTKKTSYQKIDGSHHMGYHTYSIRQESTATVHGFWQDSAYKMLEALPHEYIHLAQPWKQSTSDLPETFHSWQTELCN